MATHIFENDDWVTLPLTGSQDVWTDVDVADFVGDDARGVLLHITHSDRVAVRKKGSSENHPGQFAPDMFMPVGVDVDFTFQYKRGTLTSSQPEILLVGYFGEGTIFPANISIFDGANFGTDLLSNINVQSLLFDIRVNFFSPTLAPGGAAAQVFSPFFTVGVSFPLPTTLVTVPAGGDFNNDFNNDFLK